MSLGLALSGGGSRAMAFHAGTLEGLVECGLLGEVGEVSSVSGGSIFAAAWAGSVHRKTESFADFLARLRQEVATGFEARALLRLRILKTALPGVTRTDLMAQTFERIFCPGLTLKDLPEDRAFMLNVSVMNHGQVGRFSRDGFTSTGLSPAGRSYGPGKTVPMSGYPLARAATASAAFPGLLAPLILPRNASHVPVGWGSAAGIGSEEKLALADGGVLDNLGVEAFLSNWSAARSRDVVVSDAGPPREAWRAGGFFSKLLERVGGLFVGAANLGLGAISAYDLYRVALMMQEKGERQMRHHLMHSLSEEILADAILSPPPGVEAQITAQETARGGPVPFRRRRLLFVRLDQNWDRLIQSIPPARLQALAVRAKMDPGQIPPSGSKAPAIEAFLTQAGVDLTPAKAIRDQIQPPHTPETLGAIATRFKPIPDGQITALGLHARWQVKLLKELYW